MNPSPQVMASAASGPVPVVSISLVMLAAPGRGHALQARVSAPVTGTRLPLTLLALPVSGSRNIKAD